MKIIPIAAFLTCLADFFLGVEEHPGSWIPLGCVAVIMWAAAAASFTVDGWPGGTATLFNVVALALSLGFFIFWDWRSAAAVAGSTHALLPPCLIFLGAASQVTAAREGADGHPLDGRSSTDA